MEDPDPQIENPDRVHCVNILQNAIKRHRAKHGDGQKGPKQPSKTGDHKGDDNIKLDRMYDRLAHTGR